MQESKPSSRHPSLGSRIIITFVVAEFILLCGNLLVRVSQRGGWLPFWAIATLAIASTIPIGLFAIQFFRMMRQDLDEMVQRVVLEGHAFAMVILIALAGVYVNVREAGLIQLNLDPPEILLIPSILVGIGILISWSRLK